MFRLVSGKRTCNFHYPFRYQKHRIRSKNQSQLQYPLQNKGLQFYIHYNFQSYLCNTICNIVSDGFLTRKRFSLSAITHSVVTVIRSYCISVFCFFTCCKGILVIKKCYHTFKKNARKVYQQITDLQK
jgi:hypothetical protein